MKVPYAWLKKIISLRLSPESLAEKLTMAGLEVESISRDSADTILDVAVTANRPDCLGMIGIAREVNAILSSGISRAKKISLSSSKIKESGERTSEHLKLVIQDNKLCHRYVARIIKNVKVKESPPWLRNRLKAIGLRPINNVVDVTNYVLMEYGQPLHAFDFARIEGRKITVRHARDEEEIVTLDGVKRKLDRSVLVIADSQKPQAIAGIIGGMDSEVTEASRDILLESAYFDPGTVRRTSKKLGVSTDSSYRFERGGDKGIVPDASLRAMSLIQELAGGEVLKGGLDGYPNPLKPVKIYLRLRRITEILGIEIEKSRIRAILNALGLKIEKSDDELWRIYIPSFRRDLSLEIDLIEEIARHYGYARIPATLPSITIRPVHREFSYQIYDTCRDIMVSSGFQEVINFSFYSLKDFENLKLCPDTPVSIKNPLSEDQGIMRLSLSHGLLSTARFNLSKGEKDIKIFEIGKRFFLKDGNVPEEEYCLAALSLENVISGNWKKGDKKIDFYDMKGIIELLLERLGINDYDFKRGSISCISEGASSIIHLGDRNIGWIGEADEKLLRASDINEKLFLFELYLGRIIPCVRRTVHFKELPKYPASFRDVSIVVPDGIESKEIVRGMKKSGEAYLEKIGLHDLYRGEQIPSGHQGLTFRLTFRSLQRTLTEDEVNNLYSRIISDLKTAFPVELRK